MRSTYMEKPLAHYTWDLWHSNNKNLEKITYYKNNTSNNVRQESQQLRSDTSNTISWKLKDTNLRLEDRISDVSQWFLNLERTLNEVKDQISELSNAKVATERTLMENLPLLEAVKECLSLRDRRREIDVVEDDVYGNIKQLMDEIEKSNQEMRSLEGALNDTRDPMKLAHTSLENRKWRPGMELCHDQVQRGLRQEADHITVCRESLSQQLRDTRNVLNGLQSHLHEVEGDLERKERSLAIETTCLKIHCRPTKVAYQTDVGWLADNSYLLSSIDRGTFERKLDPGDCCVHNVQPPPVIHPRAAVRRVDAGVMTDRLGEEFLLID